MKRLVNIQPGKGWRSIMGLLPFILVLITYLFASNARLAVNPNDKLLPSFGSFGEAIERIAIKEDRRTGKVLLWSDTKASLQRLGMGIGISALIGLLFGILNGLIPVIRANLSPFISVLSMIPPLAILPILFIVFGLGELSKVVLIVFGIAPFVMRELQQRVQEIPKEQLIKAQTLDASTWQIMIRIILPQILPRLIDALRLSLGAAWLFLIAAEAIAATDGLGYRIFLVRRYLAMDVILPYVAWITFLAFLMDYGLRALSRFAFPWFEKETSGS